MFQCSSASRKFLNTDTQRVTLVCCRRFSALQRAENSSIAPYFQTDSVDAYVSVLFSEPKIPQYVQTISIALALCGFSALQRAENSSIDICYLYRFINLRVSVLFSEPKIPQFFTTMPTFSDVQVSVLFSEPKIPQFSVELVIRGRAIVSVLFSEPKIPQCAGRVRGWLLLYEFQCSSASRKFLNHKNAAKTEYSDMFQCSSASRKFLNLYE